MMTWREFLNEYLETAGVTLAFAAFGSGFMLWASASKRKPGDAPITPGRALMVLAAGQLVGAIATAFCFGFLGWSLFIAPAIGAACGLVGIFLLMTGIKAGQRVEQRGDDLADRGIDMIARKKGNTP